MRSNNLDKTKVEPGSRYLGEAELLSGSSHGGILPGRYNSDYYYSLRHTTY